MLEVYRQHVTERATQQIPPAPLSPEQVSGLVDLLKKPPAGEEDFLVDLLTGPDLMGSETVPFTVFQFVVFVLSDMWQTFTLTQQATLTVSIT